MKRRKQSKQKNKLLSEDLSVDYQIFLDYGYGIFAYFNLLQQLICPLLVICVLVIPLCVMYQVYS